MCCAPETTKGKRCGRRAFTLLEVMLAVAIIGLVAVSMFRFVNVNLQAIRISTERGTRQEAVRGLTALVQSQLNSLAPLLQGALLGHQYTFQNVPSDELQWKCEAGNGLLTENASSEYKVTLAVRRDTQAGKSWLSLRREVSKDLGTYESGGVTYETTDPKAPPNWVNLMDHVDGIEFRYYDARQNSWVENWTDAAARPTLVRIWLWQEKNPVPYEAVLTVPPTQAVPAG
jgi:prepilin-type N-terminal cleavage/methylation domain-containing protein